LAEVYAMKSARELFEEAMRLDPKERIALTGYLIESLDSGADEGSAQAWVAEIERRMAEMDAGEVQPVPWDELRARLYGSPRGSGGR
jgi:putative addiction module component (TIGR02574 family)